MELKQTIGSMRINQVDYEKWLTTLKRGDIVLLQSFCAPEGSRVFHWPFECWRVEPYEWLEDTIVAYGDTKPINSKMGYTIYWGVDKPSGHIFPDRIVPNSDYLPSCQKLGHNNSVLLDWPIYEPLFDHHQRFVYLVKRGEDFTQGGMNIRQAFQYRYSVDTDEGQLWHCFGKPVFGDDKPKQIEGATFLYSQYISF